MFGLVAGTATMMLTGMTAFAATKPTTYTVERGDSVYKISHHYGISEKNLIAWNHLKNANFIYVKQKLKLRAPSSGSAATKVPTVKPKAATIKAAKPAATTTYVVRKGDCLSVIAAKKHVTVSQLAAWNHIHTTSPIKVGQKLTLHASATTGSASTLPPTSKPSSRGISLATATQTAESNGQAIVNYAKTFIGDPYLYGGESSSGFDCSGLVQTVFSHEGTSLPRTADQQAGVGRVISKASLQPGDLVLFNTTGTEFSHVGIYTGNNEFISATSHGVKIASLSNPYWGPRLTRCTNPWG
jgi:cell wall-associated NlpC family hydrolase